MKEKFYIKAAGRLVAIDPKSFTKKVRDKIRRELKKKKESKK